MDGAIRSFNARLPSLAAEYAARGLDVQLHDVNAVGWEDGDYWIWGIHFNTSGFEKMAAAWHSAILRSASARTQRPPPTSLDSRNRTSDRSMTA